MDNVKHLPIHKCLPNAVWVFAYRSMYACMYLMIAEGQIAQRRPYWSENRFKSKIQGKYKHLVVFWKLADTTPMLLQVVNGSSA